jgi:hypothetical protein
VMRRLISVVVPEAFYVGRKRWSRPVRVRASCPQNAAAGIKGATHLHNCRSAGSGRTLTCAKPGPSTAP